MMDFHKAVHPLFYPLNSEIPKNPILMAAYSIKCFKVQNLCLLGPALMNQSIMTNNAL